MTPTQAEQKARALHSKLLSPYKDLAAINSAVETLTHLIQKSERCDELEQECKAWEQTTHASNKTQNGGNRNSTPPATNAVEIFDDAQAALFVGGISARAIRDWRTRRGLPFLKITNKCIRIRKSDLQAWLNHQRTAITRGAA